MNENELNELKDLEEKIDRAYRLLKEILINISNFIDDEERKRG